MKRRVFSAFVFGMAMLMPNDGEAQTTESQAAPETTSPAAAGTPEAGAAPDAALEGTTPSADDAQAAPPAAAAEQPAAVPPVEVVQPKPRPQPRAKPRPVVAAPPPARPVPIEPEQVLPSEITEPVPGYYGPPGGAGAFERSVNSAQSPIIPTDGIAPADLSDFSSAASRVTREKIDEQEPLTTNDILQTVPGVQIINDDGLGRHGGIGIRGSPARRSRKVLVMEDGRSINMNLWLDPSTHYVPPPDRIESVEVLRGTVIVYGPNNNHGVVNFRNLSPFGPNETVISGSGGIDYDANTRHIHTRQTSGNWGTVLSYSGAEADGAWDNERLRYNDFYTALGWKGVKSDMTLSAVYFRQRDNYDEANFELEAEEEEEGEEGEEEEGEAAVKPGEVERQFFKNVKHCKTCFNPGSNFNTYNGDIVLMQGVYNYYFNIDTTWTTQIYGQYHRRDRYQNFEGENPVDAETNFKPFIQDETAFVPEGVMLGRLRTYNHGGIDTRAEFANRPFLWGLDQDIQVGARYEHHVFFNRNFFGRQGEILRDGDQRGLTVFDRESEADAFSTFLQTSIHATKHLDVVPGLRVDSYRITRDTLVLSEEEGEGEETDCEEFDDEECATIPVDTKPFNESFNRTQVLPGVAFSYGFGRKDVPVDYGSKALKPAEKPKYFSTIYGGYHRGLTMGVLREAAFPPDDEIGNNYQIGLRSTALKGIQFDLAGFHQQIFNYQIKGSATDAVGNNIYTNIKEAEINGFEIYSRLDTRPYTGWALNPYAEASYTLADSVIARGRDDEGVNLAGNLIPEVPDQTAYLTAGVEHRAGWNASISMVYRGGFFTDEQNTPYGGDPSGEDGFVPSVWLLNARANYTIPNTDAVIYISGENLTDKLYITDREDGIKPGIGRTIMTGAKIKW